MTPQLDDYTREALCAGDQPPAGVEDRILAAIVGPLGGPGPDGGLSQAGGAGSGGAGSVASLGSATIGYAAKVVGATLGLAAAGVALVAVTAAGVRSFEPEPPREPVSLVDEAAAPERGSSTQTEPAAVDASPAADADPPVEPASVEPATAPSGATSKGRAVEPAAAADTGVEAELALMNQARAAKQPAAALALLERHRLEFADGVFAAEREVLRIERLCALGRSDEAGAATKEFIASYPNNPLRSRVDAACR